MTIRGFIQCTTRFRRTETADGELIYEHIRFRRTETADGEVIYEYNSTHPGWDAYETLYDEHGNYIPGSYKSYKRVPEKDKEPLKGNK